MSNSPIRFGLYGCGMISRIHAATIDSLPDAVLVGAADAYAPAAQKFAENHQVTYFATYEELLACEDIDVVTLCTPNGTHAELAIKALQADKSVICEKPLGINTAECDAIIAAEKESKGQVMVISQYRMGADIQRVRKLLAEGALGRITMVTLQMKYWREESYYTGTWHGTLKMDGGGAIINQGIHGVDCLRYIMGPVKRVQSCVRTLVHNIEGEDTVAAVLEFENGALGVIEATTSVYPGFQRRFEISGDQGSILMEENNIVYLKIKGQEEERHEFSKEGTASDPTKVDFKGHANQYDLFIKALRGEGENPIPATEGRKAVELAEMIYKNSK